MNFEKCREILLNEIELVNRISNLQEQIRNAVIDRNWTDFESHFSELNLIGDEFTVLEAEREQCFGKSNGFYALISCFTQEQGRELSEIYRNLKLKTLQIKITGEIIVDFITQARATIAGFFEIAFPDRGGKIYTPHGKHFSHDMRSMVLNQRF